MSRECAVVPQAFLVSMDDGIGIGKAFRSFLVLGAASLLFNAEAVGQLAKPQFYTILNQAFSPNRETAMKGVEALDANWEDEYLAPTLELFTAPLRSALDWEILKLISKKTGQSFSDPRDFQVWMWNRPERLPSAYATFKSRLYSRIDPAFARYFNENHEATIRLDEIAWGGVHQDGIPPLRKPKMVEASEAAYLKDKHVVFGIEVNGDARAYPKRILAWHEMFVDTVGGVPVAGVYCTLCGTVVLYDTVVEGRSYELGTSGFLYRSNKLMYDRETHSLWSTLEGQPVVGPLVGKGIRLPWRSVVTTTWGEWKKRHPDTSVLSLDTGHRRDYSEGEAYRAYFATDDLMFRVPKLDRRLANKDEVLALSTLDRRSPLAISAKFLKRNPTYHVTLDGNELLVLTDDTGGNRVFEVEPDERFSRTKAGDLVDGDGKRWRISESAIVDDEGQRRSSYPAHRAFWFAWQAQFPETRLIDHRGRENRK